MKRSYSLDFFKLLFACVVALFHFGTLDGIYADVAVQVFFVISGYFLGRKFYARSFSDGGESYGPWQYSLDHARGLFPHYLLSLVLMLGYCLAREALDVLRMPSGKEIWDMVLLVYDQLQDLLFLQSAYQYGTNLNNPTWQISALVISGFFVYSLLCRQERLCRELIFPAAILMVQSLIASGLDLFGRWGFFFMPLLRAFAPLSLGVLVYYFSGTALYGKMKGSRLFGLLSVLTVPAILIFKNRTGLHLVWAAVLILACMNPENVLNRLLDRKIFASFGELSYGVYLNHALVNRIFHAVLLPRLGIGENVGAVLYLMVVLVWSVFTLWLLKKLMGAYTRRKAAV